MRQRQQFRRRPLDEDAAAEEPGEAPTVAAPAKKAQAPKPASTLLSFADDGDGDAQDPGAGVKKRIVAAAVRVSGAAAVTGGEGGLRSVAGEYSARRLKEVRLCLVCRPAGGWQQVTDFWPWFAQLAAAQRTLPGTLRPAAAATADVQQAASFQPRDARVRGSVHARWSACRVLPRV